MMFPHLSGWKVNMSLLQEAASKELLRVLDKCEGPKVVIWDESLASVGLVVQFKFLKDHGVSKLYKLQDAALPEIHDKNVIFITRPQLKLMDTISQIIHGYENQALKFPSKRKEFFLCFVPRRMELCEKHLMYKGVHGSLCIDEFKCNFFTMDNDVISLEMNDCYKELHVEGDPTCIYQSAEALVSLQQLYGRIPKITGKGKYAEKLWELTKNLGREDKKIITSEKGPLDQLIIIDRSIDLMSVLATQLTYEGLIDELFGIKDTTAAFPAEIFNHGKQNDNLHGMTSSETKLIILNSGETLFGELRDKHFNEVGIILSRVAKSISSQFSEKLEDKTVSEIRQFVDRLQNMEANKRAAMDHTAIAEMIKAKTESYEFMDELSCEQEFLYCSEVDKQNPYIEELIARKAPFRTVIRLICMQSIAGSGLKQKLLDYYKRELVQVYGIEALLTIGNLERIGLLRTPTGTRTYAVLRKTLNLTVENPVEVSPNDISYVHSFYAPLSIRIVEQIIKSSGTQGLSDMLSCLPGKFFEDYQNPGNGLGGRRGSINSEQSAVDAPRVILVFFLGGCTFAEISALRFLAQQDENNVEFIVATTKLINKNTFLDCFIEHMKD